MFFSTIPSLVVQKQLQPTAHLSFKTICSSFWLPYVAIIARQKIRPIFAKNN